MYYVCVENSRVTSILNYVPNVPESIQVVQITDEEYGSINKEKPTHYFDVTELCIKPMPSAIIDKYKTEQEDAKYKEFLSSTDWKVLRHIREKALGQATSLTEEEYLQLENERAGAASLISNK